MPAPAGPPAALGPQSDHHDEEADRAYKRLSTVPVTDIVMHRDMGYGIDQVWFKRLMLDMIRFTEHIEKGLWLYREMPRT